MTYNVYINDAINPILDECPPNGYLYEFGVLTGNSMVHWLKYNQEHLKFIKMFGFDSFLGLPEEADYVWHNPDWPKGAFNSVEYWKVNSIEEAMNKLYERFEPFPTKVELIPGYYSDVLTDELGEKMSKMKASFLHIDTDIYLSTLQLLDWIFKWDILMDGGIIRYDDWPSTPEWTAGESRAHLETCKKYNLLFQRHGLNMFRLVKNANV